MKLLINTYLLMMLALLTCCDDFLDKKPDQALVVPATLEEFQALLDYDYRTLNQDAALGFIGGDNYYLPYAVWQALATNVEKNGYLWADDIYEGDFVGDWAMPYEQVFISNVVLEGLAGIEVTAHNTDQWQALRGSALFFRSYAFYNLLQYFAAPYDSTTAASQPGIPLRLTSRLDAPVYRESLQACYREVIAGLQEAAALLPASRLYKTRPSRAAAYACLARVSLIMQDFRQAEAYATSCLELQDDLLSYSQYDTTAADPFAPYNAEVIFHSVALNYAIFRHAVVSPEVYDSYQPGDLRRGLYYTSEGFFKGWYATNYPFTGLAVNEVYLIRAECRARRGDVAGAMEDLNTLLEQRWEAGSFTPYTAGSPAAALELVLAERRKELAFRGLRWSDLRRLNLEAEHATTLQRTWPQEGLTFLLPPHDPRYVYPIPKEEIDISGIPQNPR